MTFENTRGDDEDDLEAAPAEDNRDRRLRAVQRPRRWKGPLTRRRERRILMALTYFGAMDESGLYHVLRAGDGALTKALLNLAAEDLITCELRFTLTGDRRIWSVRARFVDGEH